MTSNKRNNLSMSVDNQLKLQQSVNEEHQKIIRQMENEHKKIMQKMQNNHERYLQQMRNSYKKSRNSAQKNQNRRLKEIEETGRKTRATLIHKSEKEQKKYIKNTVNTFQKKFKNKKYNHLFEPFRYKSANNKSFERYIKKLNRVKLN